MIFIRGTPVLTPMQAVLSRPQTPTKAELEAALCATYQPTLPVEDIILDSLKPWEPIE